MFWFKFASSCLYKVSMCWRPVRAMMDSSSSIFTAENLINLSFPQFELFNYLCEACKLKLLQAKSETHLYFIPVFCSDVKYWLTSLLLSSSSRTDLSDKLWYGLWQHVNSSQMTTPRPQRLSSMEHGLYEGMLLCCIRFSWPGLLQRRGTLSVMIGQ